MRAGAPLVVLLLAVLCAVAPGAAAWADSESGTSSGPGPDPQEPEPPDWDQASFQGMISLSRQMESGPAGTDDLTGFRGTWGAWIEDPPKPGSMFSGFGGFHLWLSRVESREETLWAGGFGAGFGGLRAGPLRIFPRLTLGPVFRNLREGAEWGAVASPGLASAIWLGRHAQIVLSAERALYTGAEDRYVFGLELRVLSTKIPHFVDI